jgi:hypothetical protein
MTATSAIQDLPELRLTEQQQRFFHTFGFLHLPGLVADILGDILAGFERVWAASRSSRTPHDGSTRSCIVPFIDQDERLSLLLDDPRIHGLACSLLGDDFNYMSSDGNFYVGDTGWHFDGTHQGARFIKIAFYLDELDATNGALRVIPGSHHLDDAFRRSLMQPGDGSGLEPIARYGVHGRELPAVAIATTPGDVVVFNHKLYHASWNGGRSRRMFTMNCCGRYPEDGLSDLQQYLATYARFFIDEMVGATMQRVATPRMRRHLEQPMANDFLLAERTRAMRTAGSAAAR